MCYKDEDEKLWLEDPYEYIHMKFSESNESNVSCFWNLSVSMVHNRKKKEKTNKKKKGWEEK